jgi:hypothetical protein
VPFSVVMSYTGSLFKRVILSISPLGTVFPGHGYVSSFVAKTCEDGLLWYANASITYPNHPQKPNSCLQIHRKSIFNSIMRDVPQTTENRTWPLAQ